MDGGAWWAAVRGVAQSQTRLKQLSSSSSKLALEFCTIYVPFHIISEQLAQSWSDLWSHGNAFKSSGYCD